MIRNAARPATIRDVARECDCSITTVSYVINDGPKGVHPETRARILAAINRLGYHPSAAARGLNRKRVNALGVVFPHPEAALAVNPFFSGILDGIIKIAAREKQNVTLYTGLEWVNAAQSLPAFRDRRVDGMILISPRLNTDIVAELTRANIPLVLVCATSSDPLVASVDSDDVLAAFAATSHLLHLGHTRIGFLAGQPNAPSAAKRCAGYENALRAAGIAPDAHFAPGDLHAFLWERAGAEGLFGAYDEIWGYEGMRHLLALPQPPTAIFAANDMIATGAYRACAETGVQIPRDMSIVGFDDTPLAVRLTPPLTTIHQPMAEFGGTATRLLLDRLNHDENDEAAAAAKPFVPQTITLPTELIVRESTAAAPSA